MLLITERNVSHMVEILHLCCMITKGKSNPYLKGKLRSIANYTIRKMMNSPSIDEKKKIEFITSIKRTIPEAIYLSFPLSIIDGLKQLRGAKYTESNLGNSFIDILDRLKKGQLVLFSGTPCQVNGLETFLRKDYDNLVCVDFVCHGVPPLRRTGRAILSGFILLETSCPCNGWIEA